MVVHGSRGRCTVVSIITYLYIYFCCFDQPSVLAIFVLSFSICGVSGGYGTARMMNHSQY